MRPLYLFGTLKHSVFCRPAVRQASPWTLEALEARLLLNADLAGVVQQLQLPGVQAVANTLGGVVNQVTNAVGNTVGALPQLQTQPSTTVPNAKDIHVQNSAQLQSALNAAQPGDTILLAPGSYAGTFVAPAKNAAATAYITIRPALPDSALPAPGQRITPQLASGLPTLVNNNGTAALSFPSGSHHWRVENIAFTQNVRIAETLISIWNTPEPGTRITAAQQPHHLEFDQVYLYANDSQWTKRGIAANGAHITVTNSWIDNIKWEGADTQAIVSWTGSGPFMIANNYLEAAGENIMFGGGHSILGRDGIPSDIVVRDNTLFKPLNWWKQHPSWDGSNWTVKNLLELKMAKRVLIENNVMENSWPAGQLGYGIVLSPTNDINLDPWATVEDVTIRNNDVKNTTIGIAFTRPGPYPTHPVSNVSVTNNLFTGLKDTKTLNPFVTNGPLVDISESQFQFFIVGGPNNITINNNSFLFDTPKRVGYVEGAVTRFSLSNNIFGENPQDGVQGFSAISGQGAMKKFFPDGVVEQNAFVGLAKSLQTLPNQLYVSSLTELVGKAVGINRNAMPGTSPSGGDTTTSPPPPVDTAPSAEAPIGQQSPGQHISEETTPSPTVPPLSPSATEKSVTAANGRTWALKASSEKPGWFEVYRDEEQVPAYVSDIEATNDGHVRVKGEDGGWWYWADWYWSPTQPDHAPEAKASLDSVTAADGTVWSLKPSTVKPGLFEVYRNNVQVEAYVYGIHASGDHIRVIGEDKNWWYRTEQTWSLSV
jgi:hypothetical protein